MIPDIPEMTPEMLGICALLMATIAALFAFLTYLGSRTPSLSKVDAMQLLRAETDRLKAAHEERERRLDKKLDIDFAHVEIEVKNHMVTV